MKRIAVGVLGLFTLMPGLPAPAEPVTGLASTWGVVAKVAARKGVEGPVAQVTHRGARVDEYFRLAKEAERHADKETPR